MAYVLVTDIPPDARRAFRRIAKALKSERVAAWAVFGAGINRVHDQLVSMGEILAPEAPPKDAPPVETHPFKTIDKALPVETETFSPDRETAAQVEKILGEMGCTQVETTDRRAEPPGPS